MAGFWDVPTAQEFEKYVKTAVGKLSSGFTIVADNQELKTPSPEVGEVHGRVQKYLLDNGYSNIGVEIQPESVITQSSLSRTSQETGLKERYASSMSEANKILDKEMGYGP